jgi:Ca2+-binding EF-hand superfamily protein
MLSATFSSFGQADKFEGQDAQIADTFKTIDKDDSGGISYSEWHALVVQGRQKAEEAEKLRQAAHEEQVRLSFDMADKDKNGVLTQAEFFEGFSKYGASFATSHVLLRRHS